ncbi:hypothetical protein CDES_01740 [Corynebacterium deserti GIMN1.010]|uniref:Uncharacterized protein n=1 Tax=Corynebacterium deserti GIMN1.010 TaxID=931089 RepID=A0A0M4CE72_9CORY|nr:hypothetical protein CDES_01740 [Corynebacterium deserti GIMN1.010]
MVPLLVHGDPPDRGSPRSGGDGPADVEVAIKTVQFSPLRRGWSWVFSGSLSPAFVLPAQAGMVPVNAFRL